MLMFSYKIACYENKFLSPGPNMGNYLKKKTSFIVRAHFNKINPFMHDLIFLNFLLPFIVCYYMNEWKYNNITRNMKEHISLFFRKERRSYTLPCIR